MTAPVTIMSDRDALVMDVQIEAVWAFPTALNAAIENAAYYPAPVVFEALWLRRVRAEERKLKERITA